MKTRNGAGARLTAKASKVKIWALFVCGVACFILAVAMVIVGPVGIIAKYKTRIAPGSAVHQLLQKAVPSVHVSFYLFNFTNADRFLSGEDKKMKLEEVGPFTYGETRRNEDVELDMEAGLVKYTPNITVNFLRNESIGDPRDIKVTMPNVALLGITSMVSSYSFVTRMGFNVLAEQTTTKPALNMTAQDFLWGYKDPLISLGNTYMPGWINFEKIGLMDRLYDQRRLYRLEVSSRDEDKLKIRTRDGVAGLNAWGYDDPLKRSSCNEFTNAYEGLAYAVDMTPESPVRLYHAIMCRFMKMDFIEKIPTPYGTDAFLYTFNKDNYAMTNKENNCLCERGLCVDGLTDISPCIYDFPFALSNAHFTGADPKLYEHIEGMKPDEERFKSRFLIEPKLGLALDTKFTLQVNVVVRDVKYSRKARAFSEMVVPVCFVTIAQPPLLEEIKEQLNIVFIKLPRIVIAVETVLVIIGLLCLALAFRLLYCNCVYTNQVEYQIPGTAVKKEISSEAPLISDDNNN